MAMGTNSDQLMSEINVTPFVDVMLVLLIIFMVSAPMMVQGLDVSLPKATSKPLSTDNVEHLVITVDKDSKVFINETAVPAEELKIKLSKILENRPDRTVYFKADKSVSYGTAVQILAEIRGAGVEKLGMITEPAEETKKEKGKPQKAHS